MSSKDLLLEEVIYKSALITIENIEPLKSYLKYDKNIHSTYESAKELADYLCKMGSNDIANFFRDGYVDYKTVVYEVAERLGADKAKNIPKELMGFAFPNLPFDVFKKSYEIDDFSIEQWEERIILKLFADSLDKLTIEEKRQLFQSMGISDADIPLGASGVLLTQIILKQFGGFAVYKTTLIVANMVSRALIGKGLSFAANAALTRSLGVALGPVGWAITGLWLAVDLAGPAFRKTVPAVIHVAMLRQMLRNKVTIGIVGDGSSGKDSLCHAVFGLKTVSKSAIAGSTNKIESYPLGTSGAVELLNFPGFNDTNQSVNKDVNERLNHCDTFILVIDINRGVSNIDVSTLQKLQQYKKPILVCLNKCDLPRPTDFNELYQKAHERLNNVPNIIPTVFDPDPRLAETARGTKAVANWILKQIEAQGKTTEGIKFSETLY